MMIMMCFLHPKGSHTQFALGGEEVIHFNYDDDNGDDGHDRRVFPYKSTEKNMTTFFWIFDQKSRKFLIF